MEAKRNPDPTVLSLLPVNDHRDLIDMELTDAMIEKYKRGREENGKEWVGPRPLVCLHDEIVDSLIYADLEYYAGEEYRLVLGEIIKQLSDIRGALLVILEDMPRDKWDNWVAERRPRVSSRPWWRWNGAAQRR